MEVEDLAIIEHRAGRRVKIHKVRGSFEYDAMISLWNETTWFYGKSWREHIRHEQEAADLTARYPQFYPDIWKTMPMLPLQEHRSLVAFYKAIGYNNIYDDTDGTVQEM